MFFYLIVTIYGTAYFNIVSHAFPIPDVGVIKQATNYLEKYGYLERNTPESQIAYVSLPHVIKEFQRFVGLNETGLLDPETIAIMNSPRCGVKDKIKTTRKKRYTLQGSKWHINFLTYNISRFPTKITDKRKVRYEIARGFKMWSDVTPLSFKRTRRNAKLDILFGTRNHGDSYPFDGPGEELAHAFFPEYGGHIHFDDDEMWTINEEEGKNLLQVVTHEIGHSLGLSHSSIPSSVMYPIYKGYEPGFELHSDDIAAIQSLYGKPPDTPPDLCKDASFDTITRTADGNTYIFKGQYYWKILLNSVASGYPRKIVDDWHGLEGNLDASFTLYNGITFFFKAGYYWSFTNKQIAGDYPRLIAADFPGVPNMLDAALPETRSNAIYFFKGHQFWIWRGYPPATDPIPMVEWSHFIRGGIDAAIPWNDERIYFFKGNNSYGFNKIFHLIDSVSNTSPWLWRKCG